MRRHIATALAVLAVIGVLAPPVFAQAPVTPAPAPTPRVTITGLIDNVVNYNRNMGMNLSDRLQGGVTLPSDDETYGRTRGRFDVIGQLGRAKAVLGLELDLAYGATNGGTTGSQLVIGGPGTAVTSAGTRPGVSGGGFPADNDVLNVIEIKWMYVEFPWIGAGSLMPWVPFDGVFRLGGQPYQIVTSKPSLLASTDFGGVYFDMRFANNLKFSLHYAQLEEATVGNQSSNVVFGGALGSLGGLGGGTGFGRGDDWGIIAGLEISPMRGLSFTPIFAYQSIDGTTSGNVRRGTGGYSVGGTNFLPDTGVGGVTANCFVGGGATVNAAGTLGVPSVAGISAVLAGQVPPNCTPTDEERFWLGFDSRWDFGPFYIAPTAFYQWGHRQRLTSAFTPVGVAGVGVTNIEPGQPGIRDAKINAWIADVQMGYRFGPLLLEARALYTTGNRAEDDLNERIRYYQPFQQGNSYWAGWGEAITDGNIDYLTSLYGFSNSFAQAAQIGYDRYGRAQITLRATYALTPAFSVYAMVTPMMTAEKVDTDQTPTANGLAKAGFGTSANLATLGTGAVGGAGFVQPPCDRQCSGDSRYLGTDVTVGFTWRFAPGLTFDWTGAVLIPGSAMAMSVDRCIHAGAPSTGACGPFIEYDAEKVYTTAARVRYAF